MSPSRPPSASPVSPRSGAPLTPELLGRWRAALEIQEILRAGRPARFLSPAPVKERPSSSSPASVQKVPSLAKVVAAASHGAAHAPPPPPPHPGTPQSTDLPSLHEEYADCQRCELAGTRTHFVFGVGNPQADVMFIGEAPGRDEDLQGEPFVGKAGQLLTRILEAIHFTRDDVYIANILKCRPPGNRDPQPAEIASCAPILIRQIELIQPLVLCTLGAFAARTLLNAKQGITRLRGQSHSYRGIPVIPTYHPAALLRNPAWKRPTWEDVQKVRALYEERAAAAGRAGGTSS